MFKRIPVLVFIHFQPLRGLHTIAEVTVFSKDLCESSCMGYYCIDILCIKFRNSYVHKLKSSNYGSIKFQTYKLLIITSF